MHRWTPGKWKPFYMARKAIIAWLDKLFAADAVNSVASWVGT
jgi:hypothetical protein